MNSKESSGNKLKLIGDILSLSPKYRIYTFTLILLILWIIPLNFLSEIPNISICKNILKDYCPSDGITRGVSSILKGNLKDAFNYNILSFPVTIILISFVIHDSIKLIKRQ